MCDTNMAVLKYGAILRQYAIIIIANCTFLNMGLSVGWFSPILVKLSNPDQTILSEPLSETSGAWFASINGITAPCSMFFTGPLINKIGRKYALIITALPRIVMSIMMLFASEAWLMIFAKAIGGISDYMTISVGTTYFSEIADKRIRGALGIISQILSSIGTMIMLVTGPFLSYSTVNIIHVAIIIGTSIPLLLLPETPYFLYIKGKKEEAIKTLKYLRGSELEVLEEIKEYSMSNEEGFEYKEIFKDKVLLKTIGKVFVLSVGLQLIGSNFVFMYVQAIFETTHTKISSGVSSAIIGCVQLLACICTMFIVDRFGRKPILTTSLIGMTIGMCGLGTFFQLTKHSDITGFLNYLPILSIVLIVFCLNAGLASLVWTVVAELLDSRHRAFGLCFGACLSCATVFFTMRFFPSVISSVGPAPSYYAFGVLNFLMCLFIGFFVPETKGKAYSEIQRDMGREKNMLERELNENSVVKNSKTGVGVTSYEELNAYALDRTHSS